MFTDPQSVTIAAAANSLPRTSSADYSGAFSKDDGLIKLQISHQFGKRNRDIIRLVHTQTTADPLVTGNSFVASMTVSMTVDRPVNGYTPTQAKDVVAGLTKFLTDSSGAAVVKLLGGES
ncbi:TPA_asm: coat protein [ssRNA phage Zoerhiza.1_32]|uniref:Coat protein n=2 Tax=Leviviricetes TaxID=2842243 RepID=A0A8S5L3I9_9VIRU|nr:coat protein [ssRNA phage Zoerhiza.1_32]QDH90521.1 MAG: hypothetical protein H1Rhizo26FD622_000002 [Leviviridae sp.]DAD52233.1 TPA_asm: coat protein [ssRNA phage Zoerhiza.1_32]